MKTKRLIAISLGLLLVLSFSCKRGEEDPFLSFRSRNQRLKGWWKVKEMNIDTILVENQVFTRVVGPNETFKVTRQYRIASYYKLLNGGFTYEYRRERQTDCPNSKVLFETYNYPDTVKYYKTFSNAEIYVSFDDDYNLIVQWNRTTPYKKLYAKAGPSYYFIENGETLDTSEMITETLQPRWYTETQTGKWQWTDKKKTVLDAMLFSGTVTKLSYKEVKIELLKNITLASKDTVYTGPLCIGDAYPTYNLHAVLSKNISVKITLVRPDENQ